MEEFRAIKKTGWLVIAGLVFGAAAANADTKLKGTLVFDFLAPAPGNPIIPAGFQFTVSKDKKGWTLFDQSGLGLPTEFPVPDDIRGGTFQLNAACDLTAVDDAGAAQLRVEAKKRGTVFKSLVTSGAAFFCLPVVGATRVTAPFDDPFFGRNGAVFADFLVLFHGERGLWLAQILESAEVNEGANTLRTYFEIPADQTAVEAKYKEPEVSPVPFNRGGTATGITSTHIELKFKKQK